MLKAQKEFILNRICLTSKSDKIVYPPLPKEWKPNDGKTGLSSRGNEAATRAFAIPGVAEAGWTMADLLASTAAAKDSDRQRNHLKSELLSIVRKIEDQQFAWPFREPVDTTEVTDYLTVIKDPIDLSTIEKRIRKGDWYKSKEMLNVDMMRMVSNCKTYNDPSSPYYECAESLEKFLKVVFPPS
jgi:histone acetyltransferase